MGERNEIFGTLVEFIGPFFSSRRRYIVASGKKGD